MSCAILGMSRRELLQQATSPVGLAAPGQKIRIFRRGSSVIGAQANRILKLSLCSAPFFFIFIQGSDIEADHRIIGRKLLGQLELFTRSDGISAAYKYVT